MNNQLSAIKYVGPVLAKRLLQHGVSTVEQLAGMSDEALAAIPGFGLQLAPLVLASARELLGSVNSDGSDTTPEPAIVGNAPVDVVPAAEQDSTKSTKSKKDKPAKIAKKDKKNKKAKKEKNKKNKKNKKDKEQKKANKAAEQGLHESPDQSADKKTKKKKRKKSPDEMVILILPE